MAVPPRHMPLRAALNQALSTVSTNRDREKEKNKNETHFASASATRYISLLQLPYTAPAPSYPTLPYPTRIISSERLRAGPLSMSATPSGGVVERKGDNAHILVAPEELAFDPTSLDLCSLSHASASAA
jgi:hypothetical protein